MWGVNFPLITIAAKVPIKAFRAVRNIAAAGIVGVVQAIGRECPVSPAIFWGLGSGVKKMKSDWDSCFFSWLRRPTVRHRTLLIFCGLVGLGVSPALSGNAGAQLRPSIDNVSPGSAQLAQESLPDRPAGPSESAAKVSGDDSKAAAGSSAAADATDRVEQQSEIVDQINAIRRQMGGGVAERLKGMFDDSGHGVEQLQRDFERELNDLATAPSRVQVAMPSECETSCVCESLRKAARKLDSVAADLEDTGLYHEADRIRASAGELRLRARTMAPCRTAKAVQPSDSVSSQSPIFDPSGASAEGSGLPPNAADLKIRTRQ